MCFHHRGSKLERCIPNDGFICMSMRVFGDLVANDRLIWIATAFWLQWEHDGIIWVPWDNDPQNYESRKNCWCDCTFGRYQTLLPYGNP